MYLHTYRSMLKYPNTYVIVYMREERNVQQIHLPIYQCNVFI